MALLSTDLAPQAASREMLLQYEQARAVAEREQWSNARELFTPLARENSPLRREALFALGNVAFREALAMPSAEQAEASLQEADAYYRLSLAAVSVPASEQRLSASDIRHNLELTRRQLIRLIRRQKETTRAKSSKPSSQGEQKPADVDADHPIDDDQADRKEMPATSPAEEDQGPVRRPRSALPFEAIAPLSRPQAVQTMLQERERIDRESRQAREAEHQMKRDSQAASRSADPDDL